MTDNTELKNRKVKLPQMLLVFILVYFSSDSLVSILITKQEITSTVIFSFIIFVSIVMLLIRKLKINKALFWLCIIEVVVIFCSMLLNSDYDLGNIYFFYNIIIALCVCTIMTFEDFSESFIKIMVFLCAFSLLSLYVVKPLTDLSNFPTYYNSLTPFKFLGFSFILDFPEYIRNTGIFREPGVYQFFIIVALLFEMFYVKRKVKIFNVIIFSITVLSTFSTAGIILLFMIFATYVFYLGKINKTYFINLAKFLIPILIIAILSLNFIPSITKNYQTSFGKLSDSNNDSFLARYYSIPSNIITWSAKPFLGHGVSDGYQASFDTLLGRYSVHNTSTTTIYLVFYGIIFTFIITFSLFMLTLRIRSNLLVKLLLFTIFLMSLNNEGFQFNQFVTVVQFCVFMRFKDEKENYTVPNTIKSEKAGEVQV